MVIVEGGGRGEKHQKEEEEKEEEEEEWEEKGIQFLTKFRIRVRK